MQLNSDLPSSLRYTNDNMAGYHRETDGDAFIYSDENQILVKLLKKCSDLPGYEIFRFQSGNKYIPIDSQDINDYLRSITSQNISAKNFRTWGGTVSTLKLAIKAQELCAQNPRRNFQTALIGLVASELNNTVAVCRKYYIHPVILENIVNNNSEQLQKSFTSFTHFLISGNPETNAVRYYSFIPLRRSFRD